MSLNDWKLVNSQTMSRHPVFCLRNDRYRLEPDTDEKEFVVLESTDWINVVPVTEKDEVVLVRQFRHGVRTVSLEVPGGMMERDEDAAEAARRELKEETGFVAENLTLLGSVWPNPAIQNNRCHCFLASPARKVAEPEPDLWERIDVVLVPLKAIPDMIRNGFIQHSLVLVSFALMGVVGSSKRSKVQEKSDGSR